MILFHLIAKLNWGDDIRASQILDEMLLLLVS